MSPGELVGFVGGAVVLAVTGTVPVLGALVALRGRRGWRVWPLVFVTLFFVALTQHPFPDPSRMACPAPHTEPRLVPFAFVMAAWTRWTRLSPGFHWALDVTVMAAAMNLVVCMAIGAVLARHAAHVRTALLFGLSLSLGVEFTQLTGIWGLYPCAYRQFDLDDLILNVLGVVLGFWAGRCLGLRPLEVKG